MRVTNDDVRRWAHLARITVSEEEVVELRRDLESVLGHLETVQSVDVAGLEPLLRPSHADDQLRDDVVEDGMAHEETLAQGRAHRDGFLQVPRTAADGGGST